MLFTLDMKFQDKQYRMKENGDWGDCENRQKLCKGDFTTSVSDEIIRLSQPEQCRQITGEICRKDLVSWKEMSLRPRFYSTVFRDKYPILPSKEQLRQVIGTGCDDKHNVLILNVKGEFELRQYPEYDIRQNDPTVVVRHETFSSGNDYVGYDASLDNHHIDSHYVTSLYYWAVHLYTGHTRIYSDFFTNAGIDEILEKLEEIKRNWKGGNAK